MGSLSDHLKKILRPGDYKESFQVDATFGHELLQTVLADDGTVVVPHDRLETDGFVVDDRTARRWAHLKLEESRAKAWTRDASGRIRAAPEAAPVLPSRHNRRPLPFLLGARGGGIDFEVELPVLGAHQVTL